MAIRDFSIDAAHPSYKSSCILGLHREWRARSAALELHPCCRMIRPKPALLREMADVAALADEILSLDAKTAKAVCAQIDVFWASFGEAEDFDIDAMCAALRQISKGAARIMG